MSALWAWPALASFLAAAWLAFPWGLLCLVPVAASVGVDLYHRFNR